MAISLSFLRNSASTYGAYAVNLFLKLFLVRTILLQLGPELLGTWGILKACTLWPLFLHQSVTTSLFLQSSREREQAGEIGEQFWLSVFYGLAVVLLVLFFSPLFVSLLKIPAAHKDMAVLSLRLLAVAFLFSCISNIFIAILQGLARFDISNFVLTLFSVANTALSILILYLGKTIFSLIVLDFIAAFLLIPAMIFACRKAAGKIKFSFSFSPTKARSVMKESSGVLLFGGFGRIVWDLDPILIPRFFGIFSMASYWIARRLPYAWGDVIWGSAWPAVPAVVEKSDLLEERVRQIHWLQVNLAIPVACFFWAFADSIILVWTAKSDTTASVLMRILVAAVVIEFFPATIVSLLFVRKRVFSVVKVLSFAAIAKLFLSIYACWSKNLELLIFSTTLGALVFSIGVFWTSRKESTLSLGQFLSPAIPSGLASLTILFAFQLLKTPASLIELVWQGVLFLAASFLLTIFLLRLFYPAVYRSGVEVFSQLRARIGV